MPEKECFFCGQTLTPEAQQRQREKWDRMMEEANASLDLLLKEAKSIEFDDAFFDRQFPELAGRKPDD